MPATSAAARTARAMAIGHQYRVRSDRLQRFCKHHRARRTIGFSRRRLGSRDKKSGDDRYVACRSHEFVGGFLQMAGAEPISIVFARRQAAFCRIAANQGVDLINQRVGHGSPFQPILQGMDWGNKPQ